MAIDLSQFMQMQQMLQRFGQQPQGQAPGGIGQAFQQFAAQQQQPQIPGAGSAFANTSQAFNDFAAQQIQAQQGAGAFQQAPNLQFAAPPGFVGNNTGVTLRPEGFVRPRFPEGSAEQATIDAFTARQAGAAEANAAGLAEFRKRQGARSPEADADLNGKLDGIRKLLAQQQKQFGQFGRAQGRFGKQFATNQRFGGVARRPVPGQRQDVLRRAFGQNLAREDKERLAASRQRDIAGLSRFAANQRIGGAARRPAQSRQSREKVDGLVKTPFRVILPPLALAPRPIFGPIWGSYEGIKVAAIRSQHQARANNRARNPRRKVGGRLRRISGRIRQGVSNIARRFRRGGTPARAIA